MLKNMKISAKLIGGFLIVALIAGIVGTFGVINLNKMKASEDFIVENVTEPLAEIAEVSIAFQRVRVNSRDMVHANKLEDIEENADKINELSADISKRMEVYEKTIQTAEGRKLYEEFLESRKEYREHLKEIEDLAMQNKDEEAWAIINGVGKKSALAEQQHIDEMLKQKIELGEKVMVENDKAAVAAITIMVAITLVGVVLAFALGFFLSRAITRPINQTVAMIKDIAQGEGDLTKSLQVDSKDEIGELAKWFNTFIEKLHDIIYQVANATAQIASSTQELAATAEEMASGAEEQTSQTSQVATSMEEMSATVQQVAKNSNTAAGKAKGAGETANKGSDVVSQTVAGMSKIANSVKDLQGVVKALTNNSEKIGDIVKVIDDVADQTNLLALNAAIEAARAGEQGRGFAVVADEVRKLAERTTASTKEIASMVRNIQDDTSKAAGSMDVSAKEVDDGVKLANQAGTSLSEILNAAKTVQEMVQQIATAAEQQSAAAEEISSNIESIASVSKQNAASSQQTSMSSQEISKLTDDLQRMVGQFKLKKAVEKQERKKATEVLTTSKFEIINGKGHRTSDVPIRSAKREAVQEAAAGGK